MQRSQLIARNSLFVFLGQAFSLLIRFISVLLLSRYLGEQGYGEYRYVIAFASIFELFLLTSLDQIMVRETARDVKQSADYLADALVINTALSSIAFGTLFWIVRLIVPASSLRVLIYLYAVRIIVWLFASYNISLYRSVEKMQYEMLFRFVEGGLSLSSVVAVILLDLELQFLFVFYLTSTGMALFGASAITWRRFARPSFGFRPQKWIQIVGMAMPISISLSLSRIQTNLGTVLLKQAGVISGIGAFAGAIQIVAMSSLMAVSIVASLFPTFSRLAISSLESLCATYERALKFLTVLSLPMSTILIILATPAVQIVFGSEFYQAIPALQVVAAGIFLGYLNSLSSFLLRGIDKQKQDMIKLSIGVVSNGIISLALIPSFGYLGVCFGFLISEIIQFIIGTYQVDRYLPSVSWWHTLHRPALSCILLAIAMLSTRYVQLHWLLSLVVGIAVYIAALFASGAFTDGELRVLRGLIPIARWSRS